MDPRFFKMQLRNLGGMHIKSPRTSKLLSCNDYIKEELINIAAKSSRWSTAQGGGQHYPAPGSPERDRLIEFYDKKLNALLLFVENAIKKKFFDNGTYSAKDFAKLLFIKIILWQIAKEVKKSAGKNKSFYLEMLNFFFNHRADLFLNDDENKSIFDYGDDDFDQFVETLWWEDPETKGYTRLGNEESFLVLQIAGEWGGAGITWIRFLAFNEKLYSSPLTKDAWANLFEQANIEYRDGLNFLDNYFIHNSMKKFFPLARMNAISGLREKYQETSARKTLTTLAILLIETNSTPANKKETTACLAILQNIVNECRSVEEVLFFYNFYKNHKILTHRRHPSYDRFREQYFYSSYPRAQIDFIATVQLKALDLQYRTRKEHDMGDLFSVKHKLNMQGHFKGLEFLKLKIHRCPDAKSVIQMYDDYKEQAIVLMECCSRLGGCMSSFFKDSYPPLKKDLIHLCQMQFKKFKPAASEPCSDLFAKEHESHIGKRYRRTV